MMMVFIFFWWQEGGIKVTDNPNYKMDISIVSMGNDEFGVFWGEDAEDFDEFGVRLKIYDTSGVLIRGGERGYFTGMHWIRFGDIEYHGGKFYLIYTRRGMSYKVIDTLFNEVVSERKLADDSLSPSYPRVAVGDNGVYVCWSDDGGDGEVWFKKLNFNGEVEWEKKIDFEGRWDVAPKVAVLSDGDVVFSLNSHPISGGSGAKLMRYRSNGEEVWDSYVELGGGVVDLFVDSTDKIEIVYMLPDTLGYKRYCFQRVDGDGNKLWGDSGVCIMAKVMRGYSHFRDERMYMLYDIDWDDMYIEVNCLDGDGNLLFGDSGVSVYVPLSWSGSGINILGSGGTVIYSNGMFFFNTQGVTDTSPVYMRYNRLTEGGLRWEESIDMGLENSGSWHGIEVSDGVIMVWWHEDDNTIWLGRIDTLGNWAGVKGEGKENMVYDRVMFVIDRYVLRGEGYKDVKVYNILGEVVKERRGYGDMEVIDRNMSDGVYMIKIREDDKERIEKVIKIKGG